LARHNDALIPILLRNVFADKEVQEQVVRESKLDWVIVRPAVLTNGSRTRVYRSGFDAADKSIQTEISRADVADFMLGQLINDVYLSKRLAFPISQSSDLPMPLGSQHNRLLMNTIRTVVWFNDRSMLAALIPPESRATLP
jgi:hypothetical protein